MKPLIEVLIKELELKDVLKMYINNFGDVAASHIGTLSDNMVKIILANRFNKVNDYLFTCESEFVIIVMAELGDLQIIDCENSVRFKLMVTSFKFHQHGKYI